MINTRAEWLKVAEQLKTLPAGTPVPLTWYGPRTLPNGPWMRDKCRRLGIPHIAIEVEVTDNVRTTWVSVPA